MNTINGIGCLVMNAASGELGKLIQKNMDKYIQQNGVEWTVKRYKAIYQAALLKRQGRLSEVREIYRSNSISYNKSTLNPSGPEGALVDNFVKAQRPSAIKRSAAALRSFTQYRLSGPTPSQIKKTRDSINRPYNGSISFETLRPAGRAMCKNTCSSRGFNSNELGKNLLIKIKDTHATNIYPGKYYYHRDKLPKELRNDPYGHMALSILQEPWLPQDEDLDKFPANNTRLTIQDSLNRLYKDTKLNSVSGRITYIQELGAKGRVVCMPSANVQMYFQPLNGILQNITEMLYPRESVVMDQNRAAYIMQDHLNSGKKIFCSDLSSATDRFPLEFQLGVLDSLGLEKYSKSLKELCTTRTFRDSVTGQYHKYKVGQPMGLYGSFPLFNLSHLILVNSVSNKLIKDGHQMDKFPDGTYYKVLGDDIMFSDEKLSNSYNNILEEIGVEVQTSKAHSSPVAEFGGFLAITNNAGKNYIFRPLKYSDTGYPSSVNLLASIGAKSYRLGSTPAKRKWWDKQFKYLNYTIEDRNPDLSPLISNERWGRVPSNKGKITNFLSTCNAIYMLAPHSTHLPEINPKVDFAINHVPLFKERGPFDFSGYSPDNLITAVKEELHPSRKAADQLSQDPLIKEARKSFQDLDMKTNESLQSEVSKTTRLVSPDISDESEKLTPSIKRGRIVVNETVVKAAVRPNEEKPNCLANKQSTESTKVPHPTTPNEEEGDESNNLSNPKINYKVNRRRSRLRTKVHKEKPKELWEIEGYSSKDEYEYLNPPTVQRREPKDLISDNYQCSNELEY